MKRSKLAVGLIIAVSVPVGVQAAVFSWQSCTQLFGSLKRVVLGEPPKVLVTERVPGLYESIPTELEQKIGKVNLITEQQGRHGWWTRVIKDGTSGSVYREIKPLPEGGYSLRFDTAELHGGALDEERRIPSFLEARGVVPLVPGRGVPTEAFVTLHQMRLAGVPLGGIREVTTGEIRNIQTAIELRATPTIAKWLTEHPKEKIPDRLVAEEFLKTSTGKYIERDLIQTGHRIRKVEVIGTARVRIATLYDALERNPQSAAVLKAGNILKDDEVPFNFMAIIEVEKAE